MNERPRYRIEDGKLCIDIRLRTAQQLFDGRDPAPFRERDLDEDAVDYIVGAAEELPRKAPFKIVFWLSDELNPQLADATITEAVRSHFAYALERLGRRIRQHVRQGQLALGVGLVVLVVFLSLAGLTPMLPSGNLREILREGLVIIGWVALWRPLDVLLYDWWPLVRQKALLARIQAAELAIARGP